MDDRVGARLTLHICILFCFDIFSRTNDLMSQIVFKKKKRLGMPFANSNTLESYEELTMRKQ